MTSWLAGWACRKSHLINASAGAGTNYQTCIKVYKTTTSSQFQDGVQKGTTHSSTYTPIVALKNNVGFMLWIGILIGL